MAVDDDMMDDGVDDNGAFPASENTPGQGVSRAAYQRFLDGTGLAKLERQRSEALETGIWPALPEPPAWLARYQELRAKGWDWRKAAYIAWASCPTKIRWPDNQQDLAVIVLGLKSDRTIRKWRENDPRIDLEVSDVLVDEMLRRRQDAVDAMLTVAATPEASGFNDRKLMFEITGLYKPKSKTDVNLGGPDGGPVQHEVKLFADLTDDDLERILTNLQAAERDAGQPAG